MQKIKEVISNRTIENGALWKWRIFYETKVKNFQTMVYCVVYIGRQIPISQYWGRASLLVICILRPKAVTTFRMVNINQWGGGNKNRMWFTQYNSSIIKYTRCEITVIIKFQDCRYFLTLVVGGWKSEIGPILIKASAIMFPECRLLYCIIQLSCLNSKPFGKKKKKKKKKKKRSTTILLHPNTTHSNFRL